jgi:hypothetical protein
MIRLSDAVPGNEHRRRRFAGRARRVLVCAISTAAVLDGSVPAAAVDYSWNDISGGPFRQASNWVPNSPPLFLLGPGGRSTAMVHHGVIL